MKDTDPENYCFICGKHKSLSCVGLLTGNPLPVKHAVSLIKENKNAIRREPEWFFVEKSPDM